MYSISSPRVLILALFVVVVLLLSACGGGSSGEYFGKEGKLVIDGSDVSVYDGDCDDEGMSVEYESEPTAFGELSDDESQVIWQEKLGAQRFGDEVATVTISGSGKMVNIGDFEFRAADDGEAEYQAVCNS